MSKQTTLSTFEVEQPLMPQLLELLHLFEQEHGCYPTRWLFNDYAIKCLAWNIYNNEDMILEVFQSGQEPRRQEALAELSETGLKFTVQDGDLKILGLLVFYSDTLHGVVAARD